MNVTIEVAGKYGPKIEGKWYGLRKPLKPEDFITGASYDIDTEEWKPGRFNIVSAKSVNSDELPKEEKKDLKKKEKSVVDSHKSNEDGQKEGNRRNVSATITQGLVVSQGLGVDEAIDVYDKIHQHLVDGDK